MKNAIEIVQMAFRYDNVKEPQFREISCLLFTSMLLLQICLLIHMYLVIVYCKYKYKIYSITFIVMF